MLLTQNNPYLVLIVSHLISYYTFSVVCTEGHCKNGGTCGNSNGSPLCSCSQGFSGTTCELEGKIHVNSYKFRLKLSLGIDHF